MAASRVVTFIFGFIIFLCFLMLLPFKSSSGQEKVRKKINELITENAKMETVVKPPPKSVIPPTVMKTTKKPSTTTTSTTTTTTRKSSTVTTTSAMTGSTREKYKFFINRNPAHPEVQQILANWLDQKNITCLIDIGTNIGKMLVLAAQRGKKVIAVEPLPKNLQNIYKVIQQYNWTDRVHVFPYAISNEHTTLRMTNELSNRFDTAYVMHKNDKPGIPALDGTFEVHAITLNDLIPYAKMCGNPIMKIDVQGHECFVFKDAHEFFKQIHIPYFTMEWILANRVDPKCNRDMLTTLKTLGYKAFFMNVTTPVPEDMLLKSIETPNSDLYDMIWKKM